MVREHWALLTAALGCMIINSLSAPAMAWLVKPAVDKIFVNKDTGMLQVVPLVVVLVFVVNGVADYGRAYLINKVGRRIIRRLRNRLYDSLMDLPLSFFQSNKTGVLMSRVTNDVNVIKNMVSTAVTSSVRDVLKIVWLIALIFYTDWKLASLAVLVFPVVFFPIFELGRRSRKSAPAPRRPWGK